MSGESRQAARCVCQRRPIYREPVETLGGVRPMGHAARAHASGLRSFREKKSDGKVIDREPSCESACRLSVSSGA